MKYTGAFPRTVQLALSLLAAGGAALCLGSSAFAATEIPATTTARDIAEQSAASSTVKPSESVVEATKAATNTASVTTNAAPSEESSKSASTQSLQPPQASDNTKAATSAAPSLEAGSSDQKIPESARPLSAISEAAAEAAQSSAMASLRNNQPQDTATASAGVMNQTTLASKAATQLPQPLGAPAPGQAVVISHAMALPIQPVITNRSEMPADLASALPTAPIHNHDTHPAPASSGLLGALTTKLAAIVVPSALSKLSLLSQTLDPFLTVNLATLVVLVASVLLADRRSLWLRESGYVNAARSDTGDFNFATPFFWDYVRVSRLNHSPLFMVSDTKSRITTSVTHIQKGGE